MSEFAVHFTKPLKSRTAHNAIMGILSGGFIHPGGPFGAARHSPRMTESQMSACFSEIPSIALSPPDQPVAGMRLAHLVETL